MEKLNLQEPKTMDDLYDTMKKIKAEGIIPFTAAASNPGGFMGQFQVFASTYDVGTTTIVKDGKLEFAWLQPEYKQFLITMKKWHDEGLIGRGVCD
ncbi:hypothetical protein [Paenibacillus sp. GXUN7292]|uniref:hypothetical protein n=1 Tax=Paenibacillus sp. GXUN7292 TaxID=3422499 RepID=UPI003D7C65E0